MIKEFDAKRAAKLKMRLESIFGDENFTLEAGEDGDGDPCLKFEHGDMIMTLKCYKLC